MAKDPAVLFYTSDFLTGTMTMTSEQKGKYITLLCLQHQKTTLTEKDMINICGTYDKDIFNKFKQVGDDFFNERMRFEHEKRSKYSKSRSDNRKKNENNICKSYDKHMENENENKYLDNNKEENLEKMIVKDMMDVWMRFKPRYKSDEGIDFSGCLEIAYKIGNELGIEKSKVILLGNKTNLNDLMILDKWEKYLSFIVTDPFFNKLTVSAIANKKNWQSIQNSIEYKPNEDKEKLLESQRITPEQYFKN